MYVNVRFLVYYAGIVHFNFLCLQVLLT